MIKLLFFLLVLPLVSIAQYSGSASVTRGLATTTTSNLYSCTGGRIAAVGTITATDNSVWTVPSVVNYTNASFPFASNLYNDCDGATYANSVAAIAALNGSDIVTIDAGGEVITAYVFADNYFEMYINGIPVGKDNVPFTTFNSSIVRFRVNRPFTIAMLLVDWEERLGVGGETNGGFNYHCGDGGMVAVFKDTSNNIIAKTGSDWKAQTFYTSPIKDLTCPSENGTARLSSACSTTDSNAGTTYYGLHWARPSNWTSASFDDASWPTASTYTNATIGVDNKPAYTNFTNIFDDVANDAQFIWSKNVILDNEVIVRKTVGSLSVSDNDIFNNKVSIYPNPAKTEFHLSIDKSINGINKIQIFNVLGEKVFETKTISETINFGPIPSGTYFVKICSNQIQITKKLIVE
ncbi:T9SS type A sorting domain-containing protein [Flavobacterium luteum]|uniref:T9SS type A sorting domain-containing protein n=1 Tax=Flavobacterium luteum TaxID=2026654 RepID=UPI001785FE53|nr:T9SS type A sorting domain-containing protein [Flavobacterium luteum]